MNQQPPGRDESDEVDDLYRRASALDTSRPSEAVRKAVLAHAARIAEERASPGASSTRARSRVRWRPAVVGTLAAAALAGLMIAPRFFAPSAPAPAATVSALKAVPSRESAPAAPTVGALSGLPAAVLEPPAAVPPHSAGAFGRSPAGTPPPPAAGAFGRPPAVAPPLSANGSADGSSPAGAPTVASASAQADVPALAATSAQASAPALRAAAPKPEAKRAQDNSTLLAEVTVSGARRGPEDQTLAEVVRAGASPTEFRRAAEKGDVPGLQRLLKMSVDIDSRDSLGRTALMLATLRGHAEAVDILLDNGADPNVADHRGTTPLQAAKAANAAAIVASLERKGAR
jgi:hypothetical protein